MHTSLVFLYSNYAKGVRESEVAKALALVDYYGASLGIAGCSSNLVRKLMLEGKLVVREIWVALLLSEIGRLCKQPLGYDLLNIKRKPAMGHSFARGFLPNGGHPLVLFRWKLEPKNCIANRRLARLLGVTVRCLQ